MKKLVLVAMILALLGMARAGVESEAQATTHYEETIILTCKPGNTVWETFVLDGEWTIGRTTRDGWTVKRIYQIDSYIYVRVEKLDGETREFEFNNGWPCKIETRRKPIQPESDNFNQID